MSSTAFIALDGPRIFAPDPRFTKNVNYDDGAGEAEAAPDPIAEAFADGHAQGFAEGLRQAEQKEVERSAYRKQIELAFARMDAEALQALRERLRQTVLALCEEAVAPLAIDADGLCMRITRACAMLQRAQDERLIRLHPEDLALVKARLPSGLRLEPDTMIERGALRIETPDGGIEDGPGQWRTILAEAFREC